MTNIIVISLYFVLLLFLGFYFRRHNKTANDFFYGSGKIPWLWVGASAFVSQFSAYSFTIIAGRAYTDGYSVFITYWASALAFVIAALYFAPKLRQLKVANPVEAARMRFGKKNERILALLNIPSYLIFPGIWLNSLAVFVSAAFNISTAWTIIIIGIVTLLMSALGGSWSVISSDFIQCIIMFTLGLSAAGLAFGKLGGVSGLLEAIPPSSIVPNNMQLVVFGIWVTYMSLQKSISTNSVMNTLRFNAVTSSRAARKAAVTAALIYIAGSFIWFVPAWASSVFIPNIAEMYPQLTRPTMAAYLAFVQSFMPAGMLGLAVAAMFSATMSSLDSSLNWCAGFITKSFHKQTEEQSNKEIRFARLYTVLFGMAVILLALYYETLKNTSLFDLTYKLITYVYLPIAIPMLLMIWVKRTPDWSLPVTIVLGFTISFFFTYAGESIGSVIAYLGNALSTEELSSRDIRTLITFGGLLAQVFITGGFFIASQLFFKAYAEDRKNEVAEFYRRLQTPITEPALPTMELRKSVSGIYLLSLLVIVLMLEFLLLSHLTSMQLLFTMLASTGLILLAYKGFAKHLRVKSKTTLP